MFFCAFLYFGSLWSFRTSRGPTAVGKSDTAVALAAQLQKNGRKVWVGDYSWMPRIASQAGWEVRLISADSVQVYKGQALSKADSIVQSHCLHLVFSSPFGESGALELALCSLWDHRARTRHWLQQAFIVRAGVACWNALLNCCGEGVFLQIPALTPPI